MSTTPGSVQQRPRSTSLRQRGRAKRCVVTNCFSSIGCYDWPPALPRTNTLSRSTRKHRTWLPCPARCVYSSTARYCGLSLLILTLVAAVSESLHCIRCADLHPVHAECACMTGLSTHPTSLDAFCWAAPDPAQCVPRSSSCCGPSSWPRRPATGRCWCTCRAPTAPAPASRRSCLASTRLASTSGAPLSFVVKSDLASQSSGQVGTQD